MIHINNPLHKQKKFLENMTKLSLNQLDIYYDDAGKAITELSHLKDSNQLELYDMQNQRLEIVKGAVKIPSDGIKYRDRYDEIEELKTINGEEVEDILKKNLEIQNAKKTTCLRIYFCSGMGRFKPIGQ